MGQFSVSVRVSHPVEIDFRRVTAVGSTLVRSTLYSLRPFSASSALNL